MIIYFVVDRKKWDLMEFFSPMSFFEIFRRSRELRSATGASPIAMAPYYPSHKKNPDHVGMIR